jgi:hypothetical protein
MYVSSIILLEYFVFIGLVSFLNLNDPTESRILTGIDHHHTFH